MPVPFLGDGGKTNQGGGDIMTGFEQTMVLVHYFMNNCRFDRTGKSFCKPGPTKSDGGVSSR
jgi:hypothetical protein